MRVWTKKREIINWYIEKKDWTEDDYKMQMEKHDVYEDFPGESNGCFGLLGKTPLDLDAINAEIESIKNQIEEIEATADANADHLSVEERKEKYSGKVFVVLKKDNQMQKIVDEGGDGLFMKGLKKFCGCFFDASSLWEFKRAPEPTDINWQNLGIGPI